MSRLLQTALLVAACVACSSDGTTGPDGVLASSSGHVKIFIDGGSASRAASIHPTNVAVRRGGMIDLVFTVDSGQECFFYFVDSDRTILSDLPNSFDITGGTHSYEMEEKGIFFLEPGCAPTDRFDDARVIVTVW